MAKTDVIMPQMGESIAEGTIVKWLKKPGDRVKRDEPLFEISTDKVDAEIPSPAEGVLAEIKVPEGQTVEVNVVVGTIADSMADASATAAAPAPAPGTPEPTAPGAVPSAPAAATTTATAPAGHDGGATKEELQRSRSTPVVRKIAAEHGIDIAQVPGTGISGRVTKNDLLAFIEAGGPAVGPTPGAATTPGSLAPATLAPTPAAPTPAAPTPAAPTPLPATPTPGPAAVAAQPRLSGMPAFAPGQQVVVEPMSIMRKKIAEHMVMSKRTSAHVHTIYEIDCSNILNTRKAVQDEFVRTHGQKLTITPFVIKAAVEALRAIPVVNASVDGDNIVYKRDVNIGCAVALDWGLIVPVMHRADELSLVGINNRLADLANRARNKQLKPEEVQGGTFTITNPGIFGSMFGTPIINQPQLAILGMGMIEKRVKVTADDAIVIKPMMFVCLSYDHRVIDGAVADQFLSHLKMTLETADYHALL